MFRCRCCNALLKTAEEETNEYCEECQLHIRCHFDKDDEDGELIHLSYYQAGLEL